MNRLPFFVVLLLVIAHSAAAQRYGGFQDEYPKFRIGLQGGWSYRTAKISNSVPADFRDYVKDLKSGGHYGANAAFFFGPTIGVGIDYSGFRSKNSLNGVWMQDLVTNKVSIGSIKDDIKIQYVGPSVVSRYLLGANQEFHLLMKAGIGYLSYMNNSVVIDRSFIISSSTVGLSAAVGFDVALHENIFLGVEVSGVGGTLTYLDYKEGTSTERIKLEEDQRENLSRIDLAAGLRFNF